MNRGAGQANLEGVPAYDNSGEKPGRDRVAVFSKRVLGLQREIAARAAGDVTQCAHVQQQDDVADGAEGRSKTKIVCDHPTENRIGEDYRKPKPHCSHRGGRLPTSSRYRLVLELLLKKRVLCYSAH
jgi:hypothetical protein